MTTAKVSREFIRRLVRAYEQDLIQLINTTSDHPGGDWATEHLMLCEDIREMTFDPFLQHIEF